MPTKDFAALKIKVSFGKIVPQWWRFAYLVPDVLRRHDVAIEEFEKVISGKDPAFSTMVKKHVTDYISKGTMPPEEIAAPIINIAEDILAGREPVIRAGDYIALQNKLRSTT